MTELKAVPEPLPTGTELLLVLTTEADRHKAESLARSVLEAGLAACVSLTAVQALYLWQGSLENSREVQLLIKTDPGRLEALHRLVQQRHSYTTPEWIWWPARASGDYGAWLQDNCGTAGRETAAGPGPT